MPVDKTSDFTRLRADYEGYRQLANTPGLSKYNRIGAPDAYRSGFEPAILDDILRKLPAFDRTGSRIADIGCGSSDLPTMIAELSKRQGHALTFIDSPEMLSWLPDAPDYRKLPGRFPDDLSDVMATERGTYDAVLCYSVIHAVFPGGDIFSFFDALTALLAPGGQLLVGDIPNISRRKRFFASETGVAFHKAYMQTTEGPTVTFNVPEEGHFDDAMVFALLMRARAAGFDAFVVPQDPALPMANRREDILVIRP